MSSLQIFSLVIIVWFFLGVQNQVTYHFWLKSQNDHDDVPGMGSLMLILGPILPVIIGCLAIIGLIDRIIGMK